MTLENSTGLSSEDINAAADAAQPMPNLDQSDYPPHDFDKAQDTDTDIWGIKGLLGIIKVEDSDKSKLALGVDLTTLGLNMNQPEYFLYISSRLTDVVCVLYIRNSIRHGRIYRDNQQCQISIRNLICLPVTG